MGIANFGLHREGCRVAGGGVFGGGAGSGVVKTSRFSYSMSGATIYEYCSKLWSWVRGRGQLIELVDDGGKYCRRWQVAGGSFRFHFAFSKCTHTHKQIA